MNLHAVLLDGLVVLQFGRSQRDSRMTGTAWPPLRAGSTVPGVLTVAVAAS